MNPKRKIFMQRVFDILLSFLALIILSPVLVLVVVLLKFTGEGKIMFLQERIGQDGQSFSIFKFVTMLENSPNMGSKTVTLKNDPRVLPLGKFLRKTKINELPQLINVFFGSMSIIGPRPVAKREFQAYPEEIRDFITKVRPGLSGVASVVFRNEEDFIELTNNPIKFYKDVVGPFKGELEIWYVRDPNIYKYFTLILLTVLVVVFPNSRLYWKIFKDLPKPPKVLQDALKY